LQREADQLAAVVEVQLLHDAGAVGVHRLGADEQLLADLAGAEPLHREAQHLALAVGQLRHRVVLARLGLLLEAAQEELRAAGYRKTSPRGHRPDGLDQLLVGARLLT
jgi:hypothetical protein